MKLFTIDQRARFLPKCPYVVTMCEGWVQQLMIFKQWKLKCIAEFLLDQ